jgi:hypothetical protein
VREPLLEGGKVHSFPSATFRDVQSRGLGGLTCLKAGRGPRKGSLPEALVRQLLQLGQHQVPAEGGLEGANTLSYRPMNFQMANICS